MPLKSTWAAPGRSPWLKQTPVNFETSSRNRFQNSLRVREMMAIGRQIPHPHGTVEQIHPMATGSRTGMDAAEPGSSASELLRCSPGQLRRAAGERPCLLGPVIAGDRVDQTPDLIAHLQPDVVVNGE